LRAAGLLVVLLAATPVSAAPPSPQEPPEICSCDPPPQPRKLPADEALALGRRLALAVQNEAVARRTNELIAIAEARTGRPPEPPNYPNGPIRAVPTLRRPLNISWDFRMGTRVAEHVGLVYAWRYPLDQLRQMVVFFESPAGEAFLKDRGPAAVPDDIADALRSPELDEDLLDIVCNRPPFEKTLGPHHDWRRLHPGVEGFEPTPAPAWCASTVTLTTK